jgi:hypothetical protein
MGEGNAILAWKFKDAHYMRVAKCKIGSMSWNPYIKHGTFLVEFDDFVKTIQRCLFP